MSAWISRTVRGATMTVLLLVGALLLPGTADVAHHPAARNDDVAATPASAKYGWHPSLFDFAWAFGESLTSKPLRGTKRKGKWVDASTGSGRAARHNGGLMLESKYPDGLAAGDGDHGTTTVTLEGNAQTYGRWEIRGATWVLGHDGADYRVRIELVPEDPGQRACGARTITMADYTATKDEVRYGVYTPTDDRAWRATKRSVVMGDRAKAHAFAVEVAKDHISWFLDSKLIGTVKDKAAVPGVPLTVRLSLVGQGGKEMRHTDAIFDWIRGFPIGPGRHPKNGPSLTKGHHSLHC